MSPKKEMRCKSCGSRTRAISKNSGLCYICAMRKQSDATKQLREKRGPVYDKWREGLLKSLETEENVTTT